MVLLKIKPFQIGFVIFSDKLWTNQYLIQIVNWILKGVKLILLFSVAISFKGCKTNFCIFPGGVYNSPEANAYWARRFGGIFGSNLQGLRSLQADIDSAALANRARRPWIDYRGCQQVEISNLLGHPLYNCCCNLTINCCNVCMYYVLPLDWWIK